MASYEEKDFSKKIDFGVWRKILKTVLLDKRDLIGLIIGALLLGAMDSLYPLMNEYAIDHYLNVSLGTSRFESAWIFIIIYLAIAFIYGGCVFSFLYFSGRLDEKTAYNFRKQSYKKLQELSFSYYDVTSQGWMMARMTSDSRRLSQIIAWGLTDLLWGLVSMIDILIVLYLKNLKLALILSCVFPFMILFSIVIRKFILKSHREARKVNSQITAAYNEGLMGIKTTKSLVIEDQNEQEFTNLTNKYRSAATRAVMYSSMFGPTMFILGYIGVSLVLYFGGKMVVDDIITYGLLYIFIDYSIRFFNPVMQLSGILSDFQRGQASAERIISLIEEEIDVKDSDKVIEHYGTIFYPKAKNYEPLVGDVEFRNVCFKYKTGEEVLNNFNLKVKAGSSVALVGHTGSGKSTIINLICRFYEPTSGEILIDGHNYKEKSIGWLHSHLGYVLQTPQLFSGTVKDNIRYGKLNATDEEIIRAAKIVDADSFIQKLEKGYDTDIGEGGNRLSLGQKQLISFARAIISNPSILILDEATSSIDTETETKIQKAIDIIMKGRTTFMVAHRLSTVVNANLILVLDHGRIIESGTHHELLRKKGYYFNLYRNQFIQEKMDSVNKVE